MVSVFLLLGAKRAIFLVEGCVMAQNFARFASWQNQNSTCFEF